MSIKVHGGTPNHSKPSLCFSCKNSQVIQGHAVSDLRIRCSAAFEAPLWITRPVSDCSDYANKTDQSLRDMKEIAFILVTKKGRPVGFFSSTEAAEKISSGQADKLKPKKWEVEIGDE